MYSGSFQGLRLLGIQIVIFLSVCGSSIILSDQITDYPSSLSGVIEVFSSRCTQELLSLCQRMALYNETEKGDFKVLKRISLFLRPKV